MATVYEVCQNYVASKMQLFQRGRPMGIIGTRFAYQYLKNRYPGGSGVPMPQGDVFASKGISKLATYFGSGIFDELSHKTVLDFGCGAGDNALDLAAGGCKSVIGLDIQEHLLARGRARARELGLSDKVQFVSDWQQPVDAIISTDAFEHFADPESVLRQMRGLIKDEGVVIVEFGPTWLHPLGGHLFSVFPWAHLIFTETVLIRWRSDFKTDGATRFGEVAGGLNRMTIARWERLIAASGFILSKYELVPIRAVRRLHNRLTREWFTAIVRARLAPVKSTNMEHLGLNRP
jgi:SAM-dependent methyltransferase